MNGYYLSLDDERFVELITDELDEYQAVNDTSLCVSLFWSSIVWRVLSKMIQWEMFFRSCSILLFPPLTSRHRLLLHRIREKDYPDLFSFSVGKRKNSRRTIICFKSQVMEETNTYEYLNDLVFFLFIAFVCFSSVNIQDRSRMMMHQHHAVRSIN